MKFYDALTEFIFIEHQPEPSDIIFVPGGPCGEIAQNAAALYHRGFAPKILVSGKHSVLLDSFPGPRSPASYMAREYETECAFLCDILQENGVPQEAILREEEASYTYENAIFSRKLTDKLGLSVSSAILSCQAYHARRALLYFQLLFPKTAFFVCPAVTMGISRDNWFLDEKKIDQVLGEVERCGSQFHEILKSRLSHDIL